MDAEETRTEENTAGDSYAPIPKRTAELQSGQRAAVTEHRDRTESPEMNLCVCNRCHDDSGQSHRLKPTAQGQLDIHVRKTELTPNLTPEMQTNLRKTQD